MSVAYHLTNVNRYDQVNEYQLGVFDLSTIRVAETYQVLLDQLNAEASAEFPGAPEGTEFWHIPGANTAVIQRNAKYRLQEQVTAQDDWTNRSAPTLEAAAEIALRTGKSVGLDWHSSGDPRLEGLEHGEPHGIETEHGIVFIWHAKTSGYGWRVYPRVGMIRRMQNLKRPKSKIKETMKRYEDVLTEELRNIRPLHAIVKYWDYRQGYDAKFNICMDRAAVLTAFHGKRGFARRVKTSAAALAEALRVSPRKPKGTHLTKFVQHLASIATLNKRRS